MKNIFHELIENQLNNNYFFSDGYELSFETILLISNSFRHIANNAICFIGGDAYQQAQFKVINDIVILPFDVCYFEFDFLLKDKSKSNKLCYLTEKTDTGYVCQVFIKCCEKWFFLLFYMFNRNEESFSFLGKIPEDKNEMIQSVVFLLNAFLTALNCKNINMVDHMPNEKIQKSRQKRGKQPLFSTKTLEIDLSRSTEKGPNLGGSHASPRVHLRRGHPRQYDPGKYTWVQPHAVGNKSLGMIDKDYSVKTDNKR